jgi:branched-chain amino acid aminotransferase
MFEQSQWVWTDGAMVPWKEATVHVSAHGLHYGTGVFEGIRCYATADGPAIFRADAHIERLYASAEMHGMRTPFSREEIVRAMHEVVQRNGFQSCYLRPICYYGSDNLGLLPRRCPVHVSIVAFPWDPLHGSRSITEGVKVEVSPWVKFHGSMVPTTAKACGQYLNSILALRAASDNGFDEAILLNMDGTIAEASGENLFIVSGNKLVTNGEQDSILMGVTRDSVITIARELGFNVQIRSMEVKELMIADEAFLTGTAAEVTPIRQVEGTVLSGGKPGPITRTLQEAYFAVVKGCNPAYRHWLEYVPQETTCDRTQ